MKKFIALALTFAMLVCLNLGCAESGGLGIQIIGGPEDSEMTPLSLDDLQLGASYTLDDYAIVTPREARFVDFFAQFGGSRDYDLTEVYSNYSNPDYVYSGSELPERGPYYRYNDAVWNDSGASAQYFWLLMDVTNLQARPVDFVEKSTVTVVYQDDYEFKGWIRQINYDKMDTRYGDRSVSRYGYYREDYPEEIVMSEERVEPVETMYTGNYVFGCTLPTYVIEDESATLSVVMTIGNEELVYNINW